MDYISKKVIRRKAYYYLQYKGHFKSLGTFLPVDLKQKLFEFFVKIGKELHKTLPKSVKTSFKYGGLERFEEMHGFHIALNHDLLKNEHDLFYSEFIRLFTYHSNRGEGSKVTKKEIDEFAELNIRKPRTRTEKEIFNSFMAFQHAVSDKMRWNMKHIKHVHELLLNGLDPMIAGQWKKENNLAPNNQLTVDWKKVQSEMKALIKWLNQQFKKRTYPPELALRFYVCFERIHPFLDGNGRVGRILLNAILHKYNYPPVVFFSDNWQSHGDAIQKAVEGRWNKMFKHFLEQVKKTDIALFQKIIKSIKNES